MKSSMPVLLSLLAMVPWSLACEEASVTACSSEYSVALTNLGSSVNANNFCSALVAYIGCMNTACSDGVPPMYADFINQGMDQTGFACDISSLQLATVNSNTDNTTQSSGGDGGNENGGVGAATVYSSALLMTAIAVTFVCL